MQTNVIDMIQEKPVETVCMALEERECWELVLVVGGGGGGSNLCADTFCCTGILIPYYFKCNINFLTDMKLFCVNTMSIKMEQWIKRTSYSLWAVRNWWHPNAIGLIQTSWKAFCYYLEQFHIHGQPSTLKPEMEGFSKMLMLLRSRLCVTSRRWLSSYSWQWKSDVWHMQLLIILSSFHYFFLGLNSLSTRFLNTLIICEIGDLNDDEYGFYGFEWW